MKCLTIDQSARNRTDGVDLVFVHLQGLQDVWESTALVRCVAVMEDRMISVQRTSSGKLQ